MLKEQMTAKIREVLDGDYGFDVYIAMKDKAEGLKRFVLYEGKPAQGGGFKERIRERIANTIDAKFLAEESAYAAADDLANEQDRFFVIAQNQEYRPFSYLEKPDEDILNFSLEDKDKADGVLFKFIRHVEERIVVLWAYQKIHPSAIPNKRKVYFQIRRSAERPDLFEEMTDQLFMITQSVDLLVLGDEIVTDNVKLMERHFGLEDFVRASAGRAVDTIATVRLVKNVDKLREYVARPNKRYAKKMLTIHKYPVASMEKDKLLERIGSVRRWQNVFEVRDGEIWLRNHGDVEQLIDLFTERFTRSDVTGREYDTAVKDVMPVEGE